MEESFEIENLIYDASADSSESLPSARMCSVDLQEDDLALERSLRPRKLNDYIGQQKVKDSLLILIEAARQRSDAVDHILFSGPPGLGKTTLASEYQGHQRACYRAHRRSCGDPYQPRRGRCALHR